MPFYHALSTVMLKSAQSQRARSWLQSTDSMFKGSGRLVESKEQRHQERSVIKSALPGSEVQLISVFAEQMALMNGQETMLITTASSNTHLVQMAQWPGDGGSPQMIRFDN